MKIQVLGPGCMKCNRLYDEAAKAIAEAGVEVELEKVDKIDDIIAQLEGKYREQIEELKNDTEEAERALAPFIGEATT